jgi:hypothetical protein
MLDLAVHGCGDVAEDDPADGGAAPRQPLRADQAAERARIEIFGVG